MASQEVDSPGEADYNVLNTSVPVFTALFNKGLRRLARDIARGEEECLRTGLVRPRSGEEVVVMKLPGKKPTFECTIYPRPDH